MEERILEATEYLIMAINDIKIFQDFINYKPELIKAINDIRKCVQNKFYINDLTENNKKSKISSILGLQFDYDSYIDENDVKFFSEYENKNNNIKNIINSYLTYSNKNLSSQYDTQRKKNNINKNKKNFNKQDKTRNNSNNLLNTTKYNKNKDINNNSKNKNKYFNTQYIPVKIKNKNENKFDKSFREKSQREKINKIAEIIMKMNNEDYIYDKLVKLFGKNISDKLLSDEVSDKLVHDVEMAIEEIERLIRKDNKNKDNIIKNKANNIDPEKFGIPKLKKNNIRKDLIYRNNDKYKNENILFKPKKCKSTDKLKYSEPYQEFNFKNSLRNQSPKAINRIFNTSFGNENRNYLRNEILKSNKKRVNSPNEMNNYHRPFVSATCGYGKYFDEPLQKGGISKLDGYET